TSSASPWPRTARSARPPGRPSPPSRRASASRRPATSTPPPSAGSPAPSAEPSGREALLPAADAVDPAQPAGQPHRRAAGRGDEQRRHADDVAGPPWIVHGPAVGPDPGQPVVRRARPPVEDAGGPGPDARPPQLDPGVGPDEDLAVDPAGLGVAAGAGAARRRAGRREGARFPGGLPFQVEADGQPFAPLVAPGVGRVVVGDPEGLEAHAPVLQRRLAHQLAPQPVGPDLEAGPG